MNIERYPYNNSNDFQDYEFYSDGPNYELKKILMFTKITNSEPPIYNLEFGDQDPHSGETDDVVVSNNEDRDIVFATVANTIVEFCNHYGIHYIYAKVVQQPAPDYIRWE